MMHNNRRIVMFVVMLTAGLEFSRLAQGTQSVALPNGMQTAILVSSYPGTYHACVFCVAITRWPWVYSR